VKIAISVSKPTSSTVSITNADGANSGSTDTIYSDTALASYDAGAQAAGVITLENSAGADIAAAASVVGGTLSITPDVPGTYIVTIQGKNAANNATSGAAVTFTVTANPTNNTSNSIRNSISLAQVTASPAVGSSVAVNFLANVDDVTNQTYDEKFSFTGYLSSYPSGGFAQVSVSTSDPSTDTEVWAAAGTGTTESVTESQSGSTYTVTLDGDSADEDYTGNTASASNLIGAAQFSFTPTVAGAYVLTVWTDANADGKVSIGEAVQTLSITVAEATAFSQGISTSIIQTADDNFDATADEEVRVSKTAGTNGGTIALVLKDAGGSAKGGLRVSAEVSGPGLVDVVTAATNYADATVRADALTLASGVSTAKVHITADGTAGTSTITVKILDPTTLATLGTYTEKMYFYGTVASLTATANYTVARASATERGCAAATGCDQADFASTPFVAIVAKDSDGNLVPGLTVAASITNPAVVQASTVAAVTETAVSGPNYLTACVTTDCNGLGWYNASVAGATSAASGAKTTVKYYTVLSSGAIISSNAVEITIGGSAATGTETISLDKATYEAGEGMTVTLTAKDSAGNPVYDGYASPAVSFNKAVGGTAIAASFYVNGKVTSDDSLGRKTIYAPTASGNFTATATAASLATLTATAAVGDDAATTAASAAQDAANEATEAANAATDAANAAAEAADAATAAAQDAQAAVADLAAQVATLISGIKAQITRLTNLVIKIQKKVNA
jgi:hypothetical protein